LIVRPVVRVSRVLQTREGVGVERTFFLSGIRVGTDAEYRSSRVAPQVPPGAAFGPAAS